MGGGVCAQNICYHVAAFRDSFNLICNITIFWTSWVSTYWHYPQGRRGGGGRGSAGKIFATILLHFVIPFNLKCNMTISWKSWIFIFWPHPLGPLGRGGQRAKYLLTCCCIRDALYFDMQHDHVSNILNFDLLTPSASVLGGVCQLNICYHVAAFRDSILFDMQHDHVLNKLNLAYWPHPQGGWGGNCLQNASCYISWFTFIA